jgi:hypothetical protein
MPLASLNCGNPLLLSELGRSGQKVVQKPLGCL